MSTTLDLDLCGALGGLLVLAALVAVLVGRFTLEAQDRRYTHRERQKEQETHQIAAPYASPLPNATHVTGGHYQYQIAGGAAPATQAAPPVLNAPTLPGLTTLDDLLAGGWRPSPERVLLGLGSGGARLEVPADDKLCHVLTLGRTGQGKSSFNRLLLPQLIALGYEVYLLDVDYAPVDPRNGEEWWPLAERTTPRQALYTTGDIRAALHEAQAEVDRRHEIRRQVRSVDEARGLWTPRFYALEEAPELQSRIPDFMDTAAHVLRRGRRVDVYLLLIAQSALIKVIGGNSGDRNQFGTIAYVGGEPSSARAMLGETVPEPAGRGLARLQCYGFPGSQEARLPYGSNSGIRALLNIGVAGASRPSAPLPGHFRVIPADERPEAPTEAASPIDPEAAKRRETVRRLVKAGTPSSEIIRQEWGATGGRAFQTAAGELTAILQELMN